MARQNTLANHPVRRLLWRLSLPAMVGMVTMALYNVIDAVFIGRGVGSLAIAGVTIAFPVIMLMTALGMMVGIGAASLVSRRLGVGDIERAELTLGNAAGLSFGFGLLIMIVGVLNSEAHRRP
jgi:Na+-driven multidrug efflux pump